MFRWVNLEGVDGSGKTTMAKWLENIATSKGYKVIILRGLGGDIENTPTAASIRDLVITNKITKELPIYMAASLIEVYSVIKRIKENVKEKTLVITDRFIPSFYAYNVKVDKSLIAQAIFDDYFKDIIYNDLRPNTTIYLYSDSKTLINRINERKEKDFLDKKAIPRLNKLHKAYIKYFKILQQSKEFQNTIFPSIVISIGELVFNNLKDSVISMRT